MLLSGVLTKRWLDRPRRPRRLQEPRTGAIRPVPTGWRARYAPKMRSLVAVLSGLLFLSGCSAVGSSENEFGPIATYANAGTGGDAALLEGTLVIDDGCVYVDSEDDGTRWLPVFPRTDTSWDAANEAVRFDQEYADGDHVEFGGSQVSKTHGTFEYSYPADCDADHEWVVAQLG
jgi:hypothetical protein